jgi:hypothetical protein
MRKKASGRTSSRKSTTKPAARRSLPLKKETIRSLTADDLTQVATGMAQITCPMSTQTQTREPGDPIGQIIKK